MRTRLLLLAAALLAFGGSLASGFHFDDYAILTGTAVRAPMGWLEVWGIRQTRPLTYLTFWMNYQAGGANPLGYHIANLALHLAAVWLLYECLRRLLPTDAAWLATAIFAVHPLQAEAVDYVWGRSIVLAGVLCFAALLAWITHRPWLAVVCFGASLLAKEECAAFPLVLLALAPKRRVAVAAMLALSLAAGLRVIYATSVTPGAPAGFQAGITPWDYFLTQGPVIWRYLRMLVIPYGFTVDPATAIPPAWVGLIAWLGLVEVAVVLRKRAPWFAAGVVLLLPSSSIFPAQDLAADRRMYLALAAFAAAACVVYTRAGTAVKGERMRPAHQKLGIMVVAVLILLSVQRTYVWGDDQRLWREAVRWAPNKVRPKLQLARSVSPPEALGLLGEARKLAPFDPAIASETGKVLLSQGNAAGALGEFGRALALDPRDARNYNNRGVALAALNQTDAARQDFERALAIDPALEEARENLMKLAR